MVGRFGGVMVASVFDMFREGFSVSPYETYTQNTNNI